MLVVALCSAVWDDEKTRKGNSLFWNNQPDNRKTARAISFYGIHTVTFCVCVWVFNNFPLRNWRESKKKHTWKTPDCVWIFMPKNIPSIHTHSPAQSLTWARESGCIFSSAKIKRNLNSFLSFLILLIMLSSSHFVHRQCSMGRRERRSEKKRLNWHWEDFEVSTLK